MASDHAAPPPFIDAHAITVAAPRDRVWRALEQYADAALCSSRSGLLAGLLGTDPRAGFEVRERVPPRQLRLGGRHRFARYDLVFDLAAAPDGATVLRARSFAAFPGVHGRLYRAMVIGTRFHVLATRHLLHGVARQLPTAGAV